MGWLYYLLEANLYLSLLYAVYRLLFQRETCYVFNRAYLILIPVLAFAIPLVTTVQTASPIPGDAMVTSVVLLDDAAITPRQLHVESDVGIDWMRVATITYSVVVGFLLLRMIWSIILLIQMHHSGRKAYRHGVRLVWMRARSGAFSFFRWLFVAEDIQQPEAVIAHERVHIRQWHSVDVLWFGFCRTVCWFNPLAHVLVRDAKLNHEYLADEIASKDTGGYNYALLLISNSYHTRINHLVNPIFNYSQLKKRIAMLEKQPSTGTARLKYLLTIPVIAGLLTVSAFAVDKDYGVFKIPVDGGTATSHVQEDEHPDYYFRVEYALPTSKPSNVDRRLLLLNGREIDKTTVFGVSKADKITEYDAKKAMAKFGEKGKYGAVEIFGTNAQPITTAPPPPPPPPSSPAPSRGASKAVPPPPAPPKDTLKTSKSPRLPEWSGYGKGNLLTKLD